MNTKEYINSGILEEYLLATVSPQEKQEVECMSKIYPEIKTELAQLESALEQYALLHPKTPSASLKGRIFSQMEFNNPAETQTQPAEAKEIEFRPEVARIVVPLWSRMAVAASVLFALVSGWSLWQSAQYKTKAEQTAVTLASLETENNYNQSLAALYQSPDNKVIQLKGVAKSPESAVVAFWNQKSKEVIINVKSLPIAAADKQYQLWAIVGGKPVDMGMLDENFAQKILKMKVADGSVAAFAITLEKRGGNPSPTLEEMVVMGAI